MPARLGLPPATLGVVIVSPRVQRWHRRALYIAKIASVLVKQVHIGVQKAIGDDYRAVVYLNLMQKASITYSLIYILYGKAGAR